MNSASSQADCDAACRSCRRAGPSVKERQERVCAEWGGRVAAPYGFAQRWQHRWASPLSFSRRHRPGHELSTHPAQSHPGRGGCVGVRGTEQAGPGGCHSSCLQLPEAPLRLGLAPWPSGRLWPGQQPAAASNQVLVCSLSLLPQGRLQVWKGEEELSISPAEERG